MEPPARVANQPRRLRFVVGDPPLAAPLLTGTVGLPSVEGAFDALANPERHAKILIDPRSEATVTS
jgi:hypothetical protein